METTEIKHARTVLGTFYPTNRIIAALPSGGAMEQAYQALRRSGVSEDDMIMLPPDEALRFFTECRDETGALGNLMTRLSRGLHTEASFLDEDIERAKAGAGFLVIKCESE